MSEKKKALVQTAQGGTRDTTERPTEADGFPQIHKDAAAQQAEDSSKRARNQNVLPDILGKQLRTAYGELLNSPVPDRFNELIKKLERREAKDAKTNTSQDEEASQ